MITIARPVRDRDRGARLRRPVRQGGAPPHFPGWNFRASELTGAVARVQLTRLDGLLARMRANHAKLAAALAGLPGLDASPLERRRRRRRHRAHRIRRDRCARQGSGRSSRCRGRPCAADVLAGLRRHALLPVLGSRARALAAAGMPAPDCPRTLDLVGRAVHVDVPPQLDEQDLEEFEFALRKVALGSWLDASGGGRRRRPHRPGDAPPVSEGPADRFAIAALADPSRTVREALGAGTASTGSYEDYRDLLDGRLDALVVCSPSRTHAEMTLAALERGLHVLVEKPMCITLQTPTGSLRRATGREGRAGRVHEALRSGVERMLAELPDSAESLRYLSVVVHDPEFEPYFGPGEIFRARTFRRTSSSTVASRGRAGHEAVGAASPEGSRVLRRLSWAAWCTTSTSCMGCSQRWESLFPPRSSAATGGTRGGP